MDSSDNSAGPSPQTRSGSYQSASSLSPLLSSSSSTRDRTNLLSSHGDNGKNDKSLFNRKCLLVLGLVCVVVTVGAVVGVTTYTVKDEFDNAPQQTMPISRGNTTCSDDCILTLVESIPQNLTFPAGAPTHLSTFQGIHDILGLAKETIEIASFYWTLRATDLPVQDSSDWEGQTLFNDLVEAGSKRGIKIRIVQSAVKEPVNDTIALAKLAGADVRSIDMKRLVGSGILHTKLWIVDRTHFYVGSANPDWRSFTQVKEMGTLVRQCPCMAKDIAKIFDTYWYLATPEAVVPPVWPPSYDTPYNSTTPATIQFNRTSVHAFFSSSPPPLCTSSRSRDGETIIDIIDKAKKFVYIAVMDYFPTTQFTYPRTYWPLIDDALRGAAFNRHVKVRLLASHWNNTWPDMIYYLRSLNDLQIHTSELEVDIEVKMFIVPAFTDTQRRIPYARVNHNKYMVTEKTAYIGTSNWSADYFLDTGGIGFAISKPISDSGEEMENEADIRQQLENVFLRDWYSEYAFSLDHFNSTLTDAA